jgi:conjugal transfer/entry exclusion protein
MAAVALPKQSKAALAAIARERAEAFLGRPEVDVTKGMERDINPPEIEK